jgi:sulfotransferase family protein
MRPLIHIGYHKTGTTWLQKRVFVKEGAGFSFVAGPRRLLEQFYPSNPFGFDAGTARESLESEIDEAEAQGLVPVLSHERLSGSPYAGGYDSRTTADRLAAAFPEARILVSTREQKGMILSIYKQYVRWGGAATLEQFLSPPSGVHRAPVFRHGFYEYHHLIGYYSRLFGEENVLAIPYELLENRPGEYLGSICNFLGLPAIEPPSSRANVSPSSLSLSVKRQANRLFIRDALNPAPPFERQNANRNLLLKIRKLDDIVSPGLLKKYEGRWRKKIERWTGDRYSESNRITAELMGFDLQALGYS